MITDLLGGQIQMTVNGKSVLLPHILDGKLRALAVTSAERWPELPNVPTLVEAGYADFSHETLFGIVAPVGTPQAVISTLNSAINQVLNSPDVRRDVRKTWPRTQAGYTAGLRKHHCGGSSEMGGDRQDNGHQA